MKKILIILLITFSTTFISCNNSLTTNSKTLEISYYTFDENVNFTNNNYLDIDEEVISLEAGLYHTILLTSAGRVFTWGDNQFGQLGNETIQSKNIPTEITSYFNLSLNERITQVSIGALHTAALSSNHRIFIWGNNDYNQLGDGTFGQFSYETSPKDITNEFALEDEEYIESIELGTFHSSAKTSNNRLFLWGNNQSGQIGNNTNIDQVLPLDITSQFDFIDEETIKDVKLSNLNTAILTTANRLFVWGDNTYGQIGNNTFTDASLPVDITPFFEFKNNETIEEISLGTVHSGALTSQGKIYTWGYRHNGELGNESNKAHNKNKPSSIMEYITLDHDEEIISFSLGGSHSSFLTSSNNFYIWGLNLYGEIGNNTTESLNVPNQINHLLPLDNDEKIRFSSLGNGNSFIVTTKENIYTSGYNNKGQLGINTQTNALVPNKVFLFKIELIHAETYNSDEEIPFYSPTRTHYEINQWYIDKQLSLEFNHDNLLNGEINLYAHWQSKNIN